ncbi:hypothetical protein M5G20_18445 [Pseudomonas sp. TNT2022 ID1044]|uniref:hypothetical protein n=1 Tax=Pseudomonas sp. TNT2022 ID1044 TaxID=2942636 RepID=UPI00235F7B53|nr:hypothetical protein [Pseudomonas sp. TNT2022 ID1044]MDD0997831.1 hypothetical protein [Pseudomonas sp. TNT2022 ID1044]
MYAPFQPSYTNDVSSEFLSRADGTTAQIVTGAGQGNSDLALVGSRLCKGDEIINTPQGAYLFIAREGVSIAEDFLPSTTEEEIR